VFNVAQTVTTRDSITIRWSKGSDYTAYFNVYGRRIATSRRDLSVGNYTLLMSGNATSYTATGLASGATYEFNIHAMTADNSSSSQALFTFQTASVAENSNELPPGGTPCANGRHGVHQRAPTNPTTWFDCLC